LGKAGATLDQRGSQPGMQRGDPPSSIPDFEDESFTPELDRAA